MTADRSSPGQPDSRLSDDLLERVERRVSNRREFLAGLVAGGLGGSAVAFRGSPRSDALDTADAQTLASVASGTTVDRTQYYLPAIDSHDRGLIVTVDVRTVPGSGELFVDLNGIEVRHDLQLALREAVRTATRFTPEATDRLSVSVSFSALDDAFLALRGKSWEAGLTVALIGSLRRRSLGRERLVTGIVADDGTLLPVGGIEAKARAARDTGTTELLVPEGGATADVNGIRIVGTASIASAFERIIDPGS